MRIFTVDSFTDQPFKGNPAAVCLLESPRSDEWMQALASEMRHSETAFVTPREEGHPYGLRWFTPAVEVDLCGHATLAAAHILYSTGAASGAIEFSTRSGILTTNLLDNGFISMDFPAYLPTEIPTPPILPTALGATPVWVGKGPMDILVELTSEQVIRDLTPDIQALTAFDARAVCVTAPAADRSTGIDYVSRFFAPNAGVPEDPVTGSAHCMLSPYWSTKLSENSLIGSQLSARGGTIHTTYSDPRVTLAGPATTIWSGLLNI
jgi:PhzF family phenazine biosynthesis protein